MQNTNDKENIIANEALNALQGIIDLIPSDAAANIKECFYHRAHEEWGFTDKQLDYYYLVMINDGNVVYTIDETSIPMQSGDILLLSENCSFTARKSSDTNPFVIPVLFSLKDKEALPVKLKTKPWYLKFSPIHSQKIRLLFEDLFHYYMDNDSIYYKNICSNIIYEILVLLYMEVVNEEQNSDIDSRAHRVKLILTRDPYTRFTVDQLANDVGLSGKQLRLIFKKQYGCTIKEYQIMVRMRYASYFLQEGKYSIKQIASFLQYTDAYAFSKQFKKEMGYSPSEVKSKYQSKNLDFKQEESASNIVE